MDNQQWNAERLAQIQRKRIADEQEKQNRTAPSSPKGKVTLHTAHCVACNEIISIEAVTCPHCGHPDAGVKALEAKVHAEMRSQQEEEERKENKRKERKEYEEKEEEWRELDKKSTIRISRTVLWIINITTVVALFIGTMGVSVPAPFKAPFMIICFIIVCFTGRAINKKEPEVQQAFDIQTNVELGDGVAEKLAQIEANRTRERNEPNSSAPTKKD